MTCDGNCGSCSIKETCASGGAPDAMKEALQDVKDSMEAVNKKFLILAGKGGVGKSTLVYLLAKTLASHHTVSILDLDLCGPSQPIICKTIREPLFETCLGYQPHRVSKNLSLVSSQFFLESDDAPVAARGPMKNSFILKFLKDIFWGELDYLIIDTPPGTSDEHLSVVSFMNSAKIDGAIIVTTPEEVAISDAKREISFCRKANVEILGIVENMSSFYCPKCKNESFIYPKSSGGAEKLCENEKIPLLGKIPIDPMLVGGSIGEGIDFPQQVAESIKNILHALNIET